MSLYQKLEAFRNEVRKIESVIYDLRQARYVHMSKARADIAFIWGTFSMQTFTDRVLGVAGAKFMVIDFEPPCTYSSVMRKTLQIVELRPDSNGVLSAFDLKTDEYLGEINAWSFRHAANEPDWMKYNYPPSTRKAWSAPTYSRTIMPMNGPVVDLHLLTKKLSALASRFLLGGHLDFDSMVAIDKKIIELEIDTKVIKHAAKSLIHNDVGESLDAITESHPELFKLIATMDIDYAYADRPSRTSYEQEHEIRARMNAMPLTQALMIFIAANPNYWEKSLSYARLHPEVLALERAKPVHSKAA